MRPIFLLCVLVWLAGCGSSSGLPEPLGTMPKAEISDTCLTYIEGHSAGASAGTLKVRAENAVFPEEVTITSNSPLIGLGLPPGFTRVSPTEIRGVLQPRIDTCIELTFGTPPGATPEHVSIKVNLISSLAEKDVDVPITARPPSTMAAAEALRTALLLPAPWDLRSHPIGKARYLSTHDQPPKEPQPQVDVIAHAYDLQQLTAGWDAGWDDNAEAAVGLDGLVFPSSFLPPSPKPGGAPTGMSIGPWRFVVLVLDGSFPIASPDRHFQYAIAGQMDTDASNNFVPLPAFPGDTLRGTDKWYLIAYSPIDGWSLTCKDARNNADVEVASDARVLLRGNTILLAVPEHELLFDEGLRFSAFEHDGTYGLQPPYDWSIDYVPVLPDEPSAPVAPPPPPPSPPAPGSPEAQALDGTWRLEGAQNHCITIANGNLTRWDEDCNGTPLTLTDIQPGRTSALTFVIWEVTASDGRRFKVTHKTNDPIVTTLDVFPGGRTFPDLVSVP